MFTDLDSRGKTAVLHLIFGAIVLVISVGPLIALSIETVVWLVQQRGSHGGEIFTGFRQAILLGKTVAFASAVTLGAMVIGLLSASMIWTWNTRVGRFLGVGILALIAVPPYLHALVWRFAIDWLNGGLADVGMATLAFGGWGAAWWVQMMALVPISAGLSLFGLLSVDVKLFDAGRLARPDFTAFRQIVLPLAAPPILAGGGVVFLLTIIDYSVPSTFLLNTYALEVFAEFSANHSMARALILSLPLLAVGGAVLIFLLKPLRQMVVQTQPLQVGWVSSPDWPIWAVQLQRVAVVVLVLQFTVPVLGLGALIGSIEAFSEAFLASADEIFRTFRTAALASIIGLPVAFIVASRMKTARKFWWIVILLPLGIPAPLVGIGLISLWNNEITARIYDSEIILILTYQARFLPIMILILYAGILRLDTEALDAAKLLRQGRISYWVQVYIPLMMRAAAGAMLMMFVLALGELPASILTLPPGSGTITVRTYNYLHYGASDMVASLCLLIPVLAVFYGVGVYFLARVWAVFLPRVAKDVS